MNDFGFPFEELCNRLNEGVAYHRIITNAEGKPIDYVYLGVNHAFRTLTGIGDQEIVGKRLTELFPGIAEKEPYWVERFGRVALTGREDSFQLPSQILGKWYEVRVSCPKQGHFLVIFSELLAEGEDRYRKLVDLVPFGIVVHQNERIVFLNPKALTLFGAAEEKELLGTPVLDRVHPDYRKVVTQRMQNAHLHEGLPPTDEVLRRVDGTSFDAEVAATKIMYAGSPAVLVLFSNVSDKKKAEAERMRQQSQLSQASRLASIGTMAAGIAHEINNPLAIVMGNNELLTAILERHQSASPSESQLPAKVFHYLHEQLNAGLRISGIIRGVSTLSRTDSVPLMELNANQIIQETILLLEQVLSQSNIKVEFIREQESELIFGQAVFLQQALVNLLNNARDAILAANRPGVIRITTWSTQKGHLAIEVTDNGCGIAPENNERILDLFFTTKPPGKGTGLGLALSHQYIVQMGGQIDFTSTVGKGSTFFITLPYRSQQSQQAVQDLI